MTVEADLSLPGHPEILALGDMVRVRDPETGESRTLPGLAPVAMQEGRYAGRALADQLSGRRSRGPFRYVDKGSLATIGRAKAVADIRGMRFSGFPAWVTWLTIHIFYLIWFRKQGGRSAALGLRLFHARAWQPPDHGRDRWTRRATGWTGQRRFVTVLCACYPTLDRKSAISTSRARRNLHLGAVVLATVGAALPAVASAAPRVGRTLPAYTFVSAPKLHPPKLQVLTRTGSVAQGDFLTSNTAPIRVGMGTTSADQGGPLILDSRAEPVWFHPVGSGGKTYDLQQQSYQGRPVLTWLQGQSLVIVDEHYHRVATLRSRAPWTIDIHDAYITGGGVWVSVTRIVGDQNLTAYGGPAQGSVVDVGVEEFQISTGRVIRTWDALNPGGKPNVPLSASEVPASANYGGSANGQRLWDAYHLNSVQVLPDGDLLVSIRNTWAIYLINPTTHRTIWTLGGKDSSFAFESGASFAWQHDARLVRPWQDGQGRDVELTLFNDDSGGAGHPAKPSAGLVLALNTTSHEATLVKAYRHYPPLSALVEGSMQVLPNGDALVGWGSEPYFSEYSAAGQELLDVRWPGAESSYRVLFTNTWVGKPDYRPSGAVQGDTVYASWNGATKVAKWEVLAGSRAGKLKVVATHRRSGFETAIKLAMTSARYEVRALSASGTTLGTSRAFA